MSEVKIGDKSYKLDSLTTLDIKKLDQEKIDKKLSDYDNAFYVILYAIKKFNKDTSMTLDEFMESFPIKGMDEKLNEIGEILGINFTQKGTGKK